MEVAEENITRAPLTIGAKLELLRIVSGIGAPSSMVPFVGALVVILAACLLIPAFLKPRTSTPGVIGGTIFLVVGLVRTVVLLRQHASGRAQTPAFDCLRRHVRDSFCWRYCGPMEYHEWFSAGGDEPDEYRLKLRSGVLRLPHADEVPPVDGRQFRLAESRPAATGPSGLHKHPDVEGTPKDRGASKREHHLNGAWDFIEGVGGTFQLVSATFPDGTAWVHTPSPALGAAQRKLPRLPINPTNWQPASVLELLEGAEGKGRKRWRREHFQLALTTACSGVVLLVASILVPYARR
jgi:hypothetical protein